MELNKELMVTDMCEFEINDEYYIEFMNLPKTQTDDGIYVFGGVYTDNNYNVAIHFKKIGDYDNDKHIFVYSEHKLRKYGFTQTLDELDLGYFSKTKSFKSCNIYRLPTTVYVLK